MRSSIELDTRYLLDTEPSDSRLGPAMRFHERAPIPAMSFKDISKRTSSTGPAFRLSWFQKFQETWILELLGLLCSAAGLFAIVSILLKYDGRQRPSWSISINAMVSILSGIVSVGALYSVTRALTQLKWVWFLEKERKLVDIQIFDGGSRGVAGAIALVFHLRARHIASLGALAIILRIGIDPFVQNVIQFRDDIVVDEKQSSYTARTTIYSNKGPEYRYSDSGPNPAIRGSIYSAIYGNMNNDAQQPQHLCPTNNCTWDRFATLAYCPRCIDVSALLERRCRTVSPPPNLSQFCTVSFPGGSPSLTYTATAVPASHGTDDTYFTVEKSLLPIALNISTTKDYPVNKHSSIWHSLAVNVSNTVLQESGMTKKIRNDTAIFGTECAMLRCIHSIDAAVKDGTYQEQIIDTYYFEDTEDTPYKGEIITPPWGEEKGIMFNETFGMTREAYGSARASFVNLTGSASQIDAGAGMSFGSDEIQAIFSATFTREICDTPQDNFACIFQAIGSAMSKTIRDASMPLNGTKMSDVAVGKVFVKTTFLKVEWIWLSLPVFVWIMSLVVWLGAMWKSRRVSAPLWRDNVLPLLSILPESEETRTAAQDGFGSSSIGYTRRAEQMSAKLVELDGQYMLAKI